MSINKINVREERKWKKLSAKNDYLKIIILKNKTLIAK